MYFRCVLSVFVALLSTAVAVAQTGGVTGLVVDERGPLPAATVRLENGEQGVFTDLNGLFSLTRLPEGRVVLLIRYLGYAETRVAVDVVANTTVALGRIELTPDNQLQEVVVTEDIGGKEVKALNITRLSTRQVSVLAAEGVGKLPDRNAAEAVQRLAGVVMERDHGEGRYVSFRGTPADWSSATINGDRMPVADEENRTRALNFDILPTSLIEYVVVSRALTPDIEGDAIGGSANFMTRSAPSKRVFNASFAYGYNFKADKPVYNASALWGNRSKNGRFGYLLGASLYARNWGTDNYQIFYGTNYDHSLSRLELRAYNGRRTTLGANAAVEYAFSPGHKIHLKGLYGQMDDNEYNRKMIFAYNPGIGQSIKVQNIHNILSTRFAGGELGGRHQVSARWQLDWKVATYHNRFQYGNVPFDSKNDSRNGYYVIEFEKQVYYTDFLYLDEQGNPTDEVNASVRYKLLDIDSPVAGYGDHYDNIQPTWNNIIPVVPTDTLFQFVKMFTETNHTRESDPVAAQVDVAFKSTNQLTWRVGGKYRYKFGERRVGLEVWERSPAYPQAIVYDEYRPEPIDRPFLPEIGEPYANTLAPFFTDETIADFYNQNEYRLRYLPFGINTPYYNQFVGSSYQYTESVAAGYGMADFQLNDRFSGNAGLRAEWTSPRVQADSVVEDIQNNTRYLVSRSSGKNYWAVLPMVNLRYALSEQQVLRFAATRSFRRPNFNEIKPGQPSIDYTNFELILGNPELKPSYSWNVDAAYEHYIGGTGMWSAGVYYKYVTDHIYTAFESSSADNGGVSNEFQVPGGVIAKKYQNAPTAFAAGLEVSYQSKFGFLPGFWRHFGFNGNYTRTFSEMNIPARTDPQPLPRQSKHLANAALFFENTRVTARLALNYKAPYLLELNLFAVTDPVTGNVDIIHQNNDYDTYVGKNISLDAAATVKLHGPWSVFAEANNLTNTPLIIYRGRRERPLKTEYYGIRCQAGFKFTL
jgi:TonB-dependent receptor